MGKFSFSKFLRIIDQIEYEELRPMLEKRKCGLCRIKKEKNTCPPPKCR